MKKHIVMLVILLALISILLLCFIKKDTVKETIIFFPLDETVHFTNAKTNLTLLKQTDEDEYTVKWLTSASLAQPVYLRQDISLLYEDGYLIDTFSKWKENANELEQIKRINSEDSSHFQSISFHHAEIHYPNDIIKSSQMMSYDELYVIDSPMSPLESFKQPQTKQEEEWQKILDHAKNQHIQVVWESLLRYYQIPIQKYNMISLTNLYRYNTSPLPGLTQQQTNEALGRLWEGLYKNYFLGYKKQNGQVVSPIESSIPLVLIDKQATHLIVLFQLQDGSKVQLLQHLQR
ncbi:hypothetical protein [Bacillus taeanensis]|uniref:Uncharacterized protein n=1 Tax=Bacillus taeanensis TaxID=273032 RepID=A0A366XXD2_9BACI|nr:hypothetical protein [Bacillus taeanensis]RBW70557.1 hypothetical protein DS031_05930 [Bacillus taeanensis]